MEMSALKRAKVGEYQEDEVMGEKVRESEEVEENMEINQNEGAILSGKERARIHRKRKKLYYEGLESENKTLKLKIADLEEKVTTLEKKLEEKKDNPINDAIVKKLSNSAFSPVKLPEISNLIKLKMSEEFKYEGLPKLIKENPNGVSQMEVEKIDDSIGLFGTERVKYLKHQFKNIIDNVVPFEIKISLLLFDHIPLSKFLRLIGGTRNKFMQRKSTGNGVLDLALQTEMSEEIVLFLKNRGKEFIKNIQEIRRMIRKLIYVRNKLLQLLKHWESDAKKMIFKNYNIFPYTDRTNVAELVTTIKEKGFLDDFKVWKVNKRKKGDEYPSDVELSE